MPMTLGFIVLIIVGCICIVILYNGLVQKRNQAKNNFAQIDVLLRRRHDLIQNLVETVKGYAAHEKTTFENVAKFRSAAVQAKDVQEKAKAEGFLMDTLKSLFAVAESYPELKANENFISLQQELANTENQIAHVRQIYNNSVMNYNISLESFPGNIIASFFNFVRENEYLEIGHDEEEVKKPPQVKF